MCKEIIFSTSFFASLGDVLGAFSFVRFDCMAAVNRIYQYSVCIILGLQIGFIEGGGGGGGGSFHSIILLFPGISKLGRCFLCRSALIVCVVLLGGLSAFGNTISLDTVLKEVETLRKTSLIEKLSYLEGIQGNISHFNVSEKLRFQLLLADAYADRLQYEQAIHVLDEASATELDGLTAHELDYVNALKLLIKARTYYIKGIWNEGLDYLNEAEPVFQKTNDLETLAYLYEWKGEFEYTTGLYEMGSESFQKAAKCYDQLGYRNRMAEMLLSQGTSGVGSELDETMENTLSILKIFEEEGDLVGIATTYQNMGYDYFSDLNQCIKFFEKSIEIGEKVGDIVVQLSAIAGLAETLVLNDESVRAKNVLANGLDILATLNAPESAAHLYRVAGVVYTSLKTDDSFQKAQEYFDRSLKLYEQQGNVELVQAVKQGVSELELERGNFELALELAKEVTGWYHQNQEELYPAGLNLQKKIYRQLKDYQSELSVTEAYWEFLQDEWESGVAENYEMLQKDYDGVLKKSEIELLEKENELKNQQIRSLADRQRQSAIIRVFGGLLIVALLAIVVVLYLMMRMHHRNMVESQKHSKLMHSRNQELEEAMVRLKELSEQRKKILGVASHDLKNPLGSVSSSLELLQMELEPFKTDEQFLQAFEILELSVESVNYMQSLIGNLLDSQLKEDKAIHIQTERVNPSESVRQMIELNRTSAKLKDISIDMDFDEDVHVVAEFQILKEVLDNLLSNAIKYTPKGGNVLVAIRKSDSNPSLAEILVSDNGPGVPEEEQSRLFDPFTHLSPRPTGGESSNGLGLSITKTLVEAMGGTVSFQNRVNGGAEFKVELTIASSES